MLRSRLPLAGLAALVLALSVPALAQDPGVATPGGGKVNPETVKESPYAAAKDAEQKVLRRPDRQRLWWLLLPSGLAALIWSWLQRQEQVG